MLVNTLRTTRSSSAPLATIFCLFAARLHGGSFGEVWREIVRQECFDIHFDQAHERAAEIRFRSSAPIDNYAHCGDDAALGMDDIDRLLHASAAGDNVFN